MILGKGYLKVSIQIYETKLPLLTVKLPMNLFFSCFCIRGKAIDGGWINKVLYHEELLKQNIQQEAHNGWELMLLFRITENKEISWEAHVQMGC